MAMRKPPFTSQLGLYSDKFLENLRKGDRWIAKKREVIAGILYDRSGMGIY